MYPTAELHRYVFWVLTSGGVLDLLAYNEVDHSIWLQAIETVGQDNARRGDVGQGLRRQQRIKGSGLASPPVQPRQRVVPSLIENIAPTDTSQLNTSNASKLFIGGVSTSTPRFSTPVTSEQVGVALDSHMTDYTSSKIFNKNDVFITSTPRANDVI